MLSKKPMTFSEMLEALGVSSSFLTYHLENLGELVGKTNDGTYKLSSFGEAAITTMTKVEDIPTRPLETITRRFKADETKQSKVVRRSVAIALGMMCIILVAGISGAVAYYLSVLNNKDRTISSQNALVSSLTSQNKQLQTWLDGNKTDLQNQIDTLEAPSLIDIDLRAYDNRSSGTPYFHIYGYISNAGRKPAFNPTLYIEGWHEETQYPPLNALAFNTTISSPTNGTISEFWGVIEPESFAYVDSKIYYSGSGITSGRLWSSPAGINETYWVLPLIGGILLPIWNETLPTVNGTSIP
jgi:hypothetical protein